MNARALPNRSTARFGLRVNFSWMLVGSVVYSACQWGELVVLTKLGSPVMVGQFALGLSIVVPVMAFATLKTRLVQATDADADYTYADYLTLRLVTTALALMVIIGLALFVDYDQSTALVIIAVGAAKGIESLSDIIYGLFQQHERMDRMAKSLLLRGPLALVALGLGVFLTGSVVWGAVGMAAVWLAVLVLYDLRNAARTLAPASGTARTRVHWTQAVQLSRSPRRLANLAWLALPLGIVVALESFGTNIPRYFVERELGLYFLGIFAAMAYLKRAGIVVITALGLSASSRLSVYYAGGEWRAFRSLLLRLVGLGAFIGGAGLLLTALFGRPVMTLMYQPEYALYQSVLMVIVAAAAIDFIGTGADYGVTATRHFRQQMMLFIIVTASTLAAAALLVPAYGLMGAAVALLIAAIVRLAGNGVIVLLALRGRANGADGLTAAVPFSLRAMIDREDEPPHQTD